MYSRKMVKKVIIEQLVNMSEPCTSLVSWTDFLLMIIAHESAKGRYIKQIKGPALGLSQMEPATHDDVAAYLSRNKKWVNYVNSEFGGFDSSKLYDLRYMVFMSRAFFFRFPELLPDQRIEDMAAYAKKRWNTKAGKATPEDYLNAFLDWE